MVWIGSAQDTRDSFGPQLVVLFWEVVETWGGGVALLEEVAADRKVKAVLWDQNVNLSCWTFTPDH